MDQVGSLTLDICIRLGAKYWIYVSGWDPNNGYMILVESFGYLYPVVVSKSFDDYST